MFDGIEAKSPKVKSVGQPNRPILDFIANLVSDTKKGEYLGMIVVDIRKHEVVIISKLSADALSPVFVVPHDAKQLMSADRIILQSEM
jgi:hypothetical protein